MTTIPFTYYIEEVLNRNISVEDRELYLLYREGLLNPTDTLNALHIILNALSMPDEPIVLTSIEAYEQTIERAILNNDIRSKEYNREDDRILKEMKGEGASAEDIAKRLGRTIGSIHSRWAKNK